jgi:hypothetical protein
MLQIHAALALLLMGDFNTDAAEFVPASRGFPFGKIRFLFGKIGFRV